MSKIKVAVAGYGVIGQRLADGVAMQGDMELVGVADLAPTLSVRALAERDMIGANGTNINFIWWRGRIKPSLTRWAFQHLAPLMK